MKLLIFVFTLFFSLSSYAGVPLRVSLDVLANKTDHVLTGHVTDVDMIDGDGNQITDLNAMTGPSLKNKIRLIIQVDEVHLTTADSVPKKLAVPLDSFLHYRFGQVKSVHSFDGRKFLVLLKGKDFQPPVAGVFSRGLDELDKVLKIINQRKSKEVVDIKLKSDPFPSSAKYSCPTYVTKKTCDLLIEFQNNY
ncbi:hypothetical protein EOL70_06385 [Leucothrix sargassi]|nr:hypothetical protein EOL70_06385 [Leucothrix sargassi]